MRKESVMNKSGVSAVVATVLIIMITVAAVGIIWAVIIPMIRDNLGSSVQCNDADVSIGTSQGFTCYDAANKVVGVQVVKGANDVNVSGLRVFASSSGSSVSYSTDFVFEKTSSRIFYINVSTLASLDEVSVVPVLTDGRSSKECSKVILKVVPSCTFNEQELALAAQSNMLIGKDCSATSDCEERLCSSKSCNSGTEKCEYSLLPSGTQQAGLCDGSLKCDGAGNCANCLTNDECPDLQECKDPLCSAGTCGVTNSLVETVCDNNGAPGKCDSNGNCLQCLSDNDCDTSDSCTALNSCSPEGTCVHADRFPCTVYQYGFENGAEGWTSEGNNNLNLWSYGAPIYGSVYSGSSVAMINTPIPMDTCSDNGNAWSFCYYGFYDPESCNNEPSDICNWYQTGYCYDSSWWYDYGLFDTYDGCLAAGGYFYSYSAECSTILDCSSRSIENCASDSFCYVSGVEGPHNTYQVLYSPLIGVSGLNSASVDFYQYLNSEGCCDPGTVYISNDGGSNWAYLDSRKGYYEWGQSSFDITPYLPAENVQLKFEFTTDGSVLSLGGWFIDDFKVRRNS